MRRFLFFLLMFLVELATAQSYEALSLLYARNGINGSARTMGAGGAFGSVGADIGSMTVNPAGLALFRASDFSVSPGLAFSHNRTGFLGAPTKENSNRFYLNQAGIVFAKVNKKVLKKSNFTFNQVRLHSFALAINFQRQALFNRTQGFSGTNNSNSAIDAFAYYVNQTGAPLNLSNYPAEMVYAKQAGLLQLNSLNGSYESMVHAPIQQSGNVNTKGAIDVLDLAFAFNFNDKVYLGADVGIPFLNYTNDSWFMEEKTGDSSFRYYTFQSNQRVNGLGVNAKFGLIYRPAPCMRFGVAYHIPTTYFLTETFSTSMDSYADTTVHLYDDYYPATYRVRSPMKGVISASFYLKQLGFISVDYEVLNYGGSKYKLETGLESISDTLNSYIKRYYTFGHNVKIGAEAAYKSLRFRAGYGFSATPYRKNFRTDGFTEMRNYATAGFGYRGKHFYADLAYVFSRMKDVNYPYADFTLKNKLSTHTFVISIGWKLFRDVQ